MPIIDAANPDIITNNSAIAAKKQLIANLTGADPSALTTRAALMSYLLQGNQSTLYEECGYPEYITALMYRAMYDREGVAARVVKFMPEMCWESDPDIFEVEDENAETGMEEDVNILIEEHRLFSYLERLDIAAGIGSYAIMLIGVKGSGALETPLEGVNETGGYEREPRKRPKKKSKPKTKRGGDDTGDDDDAPPPTPAGDAGASPIKNKFAYFRIYDQSVLDILTIDKEATSPRFGHPLTYRIRAHQPHQSETATEAVMQDLTVHWTRCIHVPSDGLLSNEIFGSPRMQDVYNRLLDLRKIMGSSAEMFYKGGFPGYVFEVNPDLMNPEMDAESLQEQFEGYSKRLQRYMAIEGVSAKSLQVQLGDPTAHVASQIDYIAIAKGIPTRVFKGTEEAKLASGQDVKASINRAKRRQARYVTDYIIRATIDRLIAVGIVRPPADGQYSVKWPDLAAPSDKERAELMKIIVDALVAYMGNDLDALIPPEDLFIKLLAWDRDEVVEMLDAALAAFDDETNLGSLTADDPLVPIDPVTGMPTQQRLGAANPGNPPPPPQPTPGPPQQPPAPVKKAPAKKKKPQPA